MHDHPVNPLCSDCGVANQLPCCGCLPLKVHDSETWCCDAIGSHGSDYRTKMDKVAVEVADRGIVSH